MSAVPQQTTSHGQVARFAWDDPLLLDDELSEDERMIRDTARAYAQDKLAAGVSSTPTRARRPTGRSSPKWANSACWA